MVTSLEGMEAISELKDWPAWRAHMLRGDRKGTWSLTVTGNWRLTFIHLPASNEIAGLQLEDYH